MAGTPGGNTGTDYCSYVVKAEEIEIQLSFLRVMNSFDPVN